MELHEVTLGVKRLRRFSASSEAKTVPGDEPQRSFPEELQFTVFSPCEPPEFDHRRRQKVAQASTKRQVWSSLISVAPKFARSG